MILASFSFQTTQEVALHGGRADALSPAQTTPVDAVQVLLKNHFLEALTGSLKRLNPWNTLPKRAATVQTAALTEVQAQHALPEAPIIVPDRPPTPALVSQTRTIAVGTRYRPGMPGRYRNRAAGSFYRGNLVLGQTQEDLSIGQIKISQDCFTNLGLGFAPGIDQEPKCRLPR